MDFSARTLELVTEHVMLVLALIGRKVSDCDQMVPGDPATLPVVPPVMADPSVYVHVMTTPGYTEVKVVQVNTRSTDSTAPPGGFVTDTCPLLGPSRT